MLGDDYQHEDMSETGYEDHKRYHDLSHKNCEDNAGDILRWYQGIGFLRKAFIDPNMTVRNNLLYYIVKNNQTCREYFEQNAPPHLLKLLDRYSVPKPITEIPEGISYEDLKKLCTTYMNENISLYKLLSTALGQYPLKT